jgi:hypothetical protein
LFDFDEKAESEFPGLGFLVYISCIKSNNMLIKPFEAVQIGDTAIDYALNKSEVYDKGTMIEMLNKYFNRLPSNLSEYVADGFTFNTQCIVIKEHHAPTLFGDLLMHMYGTNGAYVEEPTVTLVPVLEDEYDNFHPIDNI